MTVAQPLSIEDAVKARAFSDCSPLAFSPDGKSVAYVVQDAQRTRYSAEGAARFYAATGLLARAQGSDVWIANAENGEARNLTAGIGDNWRPTWSPNGRYLAFLSTRDGSGQTRLWLWDATADRLRKASDENVRPTLENEIVWLPDSKGILITTVPQGMTVDEYVQEVSAPPNGEVRPGNTASSARVRVFRAAAIDAGKGQVVRADLFNLKSNFFHDLTRIDVASGRSSVVVDRQMIESFAVSPDSRRIAYARPTRFLAPGSPQLVYDLTVVNLSDLHVQVAVPNALLDGAAVWSPDSSRLAYRECSGKCDYYEITLGGGSIRKLSLLPVNRYNGAIEAPLWDKQGEHIYFVFEGALWRSSVTTGVSTEVGRIQGRRILYRIAQPQGTLWTPGGGQSTVVLAYDDDTKQDGFYRIDLRTGLSTKLLEDGKCYTCTGLGTDLGSYLAAASQDGRRVAYFVEDAAHPPDLWINNDNFDRARRLTHLNPQLEQYKMGSARLVSWLSDDGHILKGAVLLPPDYQDGKRYPLVVWVYRQDFLSNKLNHFGFGEYPGPLNLQLLATRGYAVLFPDAREEVGFPMAGLEKSVLPGVSKLVELGIADPDRLAVMGHSFGGYSALALIVQTKRFKAAVEISGFGNLLGLYGTMLEDGTAVGYRAGEVILGGNPWQVPERYRENSPLTYLDRVETPLLIVHGSHDFSAVAPFLADELFTDLRRLGKEVEFVKYEGEDHVPRDWSFPNQEDLGNRIIAWLDRYLRSVPE